MRVTAAILGALWLAGCASKDPPRAMAPPGSPAPAAPNADDAARPLTGGECQSLAQWIVGACQERGNDRSSQVDGWCSDVVSRAASGDDAWVKDDCVPHIKYMDAACFRSTTSIRAMIDCDRNVDRSR
ncbi:MAG: hypothetical protein M3O36_21120 [Myxococcota bacterium]|nr:hypothetical protein [Myxococcota bacterium]